MKMKNKRVSEFFSRPYVKLEWLKQRTHKNHFAMKAQIYLAAQKAAHTELAVLSRPIQAA